MTEVMWTVPADHPAFAGHFPGRPILPGVVLLDHVLALAAAEFSLDPATLRIASAKFLSPALPGETLGFSLQERNKGSVQFDIRCGERMVATGSLAARIGVAT